MKRLRKTLSVISGKEMTDDEFTVRELVLDVLFVIMGLAALAAASIIADFV